MRFALVVILVVSSWQAGWMRAAPAGFTAADKERENLARSLSTACRRFAGDDHWAELDRCNRAWFHQNEEAVWRLHLNPHATRQDAPPS